MCTEEQTDKQQFHNQTTLCHLILLFLGLQWQQILERDVCSSFEKIKDLLDHPYIEVPLPYMERRPLTYLVSPSTDVKLKKNNPWSVFLIFGPPWGSEPTKEGMSRNSLLRIQRDVVSREGETGEESRTLLS